MTATQDRATTTQLAQLSTLQRARLARVEQALAVLRRVERDYAMRVRGETPHPLAADELLASMRSVINLCDGVSEGAA